MRRSRHLLGATLLAIVGLGGSAAGAAQDVMLRFVLTAPEAGPDATVHLAGNFQGWDPGDPAYQLQPDADGHLSLSFPAQIGQNLQFKFTLGSWSGVEKGPDGEEIANRTLHVTGPGTHTFEVYTWASGQPAPPREHTLTGDVGLLEPSPFPDDRPVWVYLPPGYDDHPERRYPVLYMWDGQNIFDGATSFVGEWEVDETCERLIAAGRVAPLIVVALSNGGARRSREYTPWPDPQFTRGESGGGPDHLQLVIDAIIPRINHDFRTLPGPENTGLAGSSFGGLITLLAAGTHPDVFGRLGIFSPSLWWHREQPNAFAAQHIRPGVRLYVDMGGRESGNLEDADGNGIDDSLDQLRRFAGTLERHGFVNGKDLMVVEEPDGRHHEDSWAQRFPAALEFLFPPGDFQP